MSFRQVSGSLAGALIVIGALGLAAAGPARAAKPIYPSYEGFTRTADGLIALIFGYYSANTVPISLEAGAENGFSPSPQDRGQPTTFLPGHQRSVCIMLVPGDYEGNVQWTLGSGDSAITTTDLGGPDSLYQIEEISLVRRTVQALDAAAAERGVCINRAPVVRAGSPASCAVGESLLLEGLVRDEGLPRGGRLTSSWTLVSGPGEAHFTDSSQSSTAVAFDRPGEYVLRLTAADSELTAESDITITVE